MFLRERYGDTTDTIRLKLTTSKKLWFNLFAYRAINSNRDTFLVNLKFSKSWLSKMWFVSNQRLRDNLNNKNDNGN